MNSNSKHLWSVSTHCEESVVVPCVVVRAVVVGTFVCDVASGEHKPHIFGQIFAFSLSRHAVIRKSNSTQRGSVSSQTSVVVVGKRVVVDTTEHNPHICGQSCA